MNMIVRTSTETTKQRVCNECKETLGDISDAPPMDGPAVRGSISKSGASSILDLSIPQEQLRAPNMTKRQHIAHELFTTEKTYIRLLTVLRDMYVDPILADSESRFVKIGKVCDLTSDDNLTSMRVFLTSVRTIHDLNMQVFKELHDRINGWNDDMTLGDIFIAKAGLFPMYSTYSDAQLWGSRLLTIYAKKNQDYANFIAEAEADERSENQTFNALLILPIQRVLRYKMMLEDSLKDLKKKKPQHADIPLLEQALKKLTVSAMHVNDVIKIRENQQEILALDAMWSGYECSKAGRTLIRRGDLVKRCRRADKTFHYVLFSDVIIYGSSKSNGNHYEHHREIQLKTCSVVEDEVDDSKKRPGFQIFDTTKSFVAFTVSQPEKKDWCNDLQNAIKAAREKAGLEEQKDGHAAIWSPDSAQKICPLCDKKGKKTSFTLLRRRHHCRKCGTVACDTCTSFRKLIPNISEKEVRVCEDCFNSTESSAAEDDDDEEDDVAERRNSSNPQHVSLAERRQTKKLELDQIGNLNLTEAATVASDSDTE